MPFFKDLEENNSFKLYESKSHLSIQIISSTLSTILSQLKIAQCKMNLSYSNDINTILSIHMFYMLSLNKNVFIPYEKFAFPCSKEVLLFMA